MNFVLILMMFISRVLQGLQYILIGPTGLDESLSQEIMSANDDTYCNDIESDVDSWRIPVFI